MRQPLKGQGHLRSTRACLCVLGPEGKAGLIRGVIDGWLTERQGERLSAWLDAVRCVLLA